MSKNPLRCQTATISAIWRCLSIAGNISTYHYTLAGWITHDVCRLCKTNPFHCTIHGDTGLRSPIPPVPLPNHSQSCLKTAAWNGFLTGERHRVPIRSGMTRDGQVGRPVAHYRRQTRTSAIHRKETAGMSVRNSGTPPLLTKEGAGRSTHSKMKNKLILPHYAGAHELTANNSRTRTTKPLPFPLRFPHLPHYPATISTPLSLPVPLHFIPCYNIGLGLVWLRYAALENRKIDQAVRGPESIHRYRVRTDRRRIDRSGGAKRFRQNHPHHDRSGAASSDPGESRIFRGR